jgi:hypothetical protein
MPSMRKARSRVKKSMKNATVDFRVHSRRREVKMNQACCTGVSLGGLQKTNETHHKVEA